MIIDCDSVFKVTLIKDDKRTGYKSGMVFNPKGVYWNNGNVIVVGERGHHSMRIAFPQDEVAVEVLFPHGLTATE